MSFADKYLRTVVQESKDVSLQCICLLWVLGNVIRNEGEPYANQKTNQRRRSSPVQIKWVEMRVLKTTLGIKQPKIHIHSNFLVAAPHPISHCGVWPRIVEHGNSMPVTRDRCNIHLYFLLGSYACSSQRPPTCGMIDPIRQVSGDVATHAGKDRDLIRILHCKLLQLKPCRAI